MDVLHVGTPEPSVAERLRANFARAQARATQEFELPTIEGLWIVFRQLTDIAEVQDSLAEVNEHLAPSQVSIEAATRMLVASSVDSYALIDGTRHEIGLRLGLGLYDHLFPAENGEIRPATDAEAVALMFQTADGSTDTLSLVMFAQRLDVSKKMLRAFVEGEPGKS